MKSLWLLLISFLLYASSFGQTTIQKVSSTQISQGTTFDLQVIEDSKPKTPLLNYRVRKGELIFQLGFDEVYKLGNTSNWSAEVEFSVSGGANEINIAKRKISINKDNPKAIYVFKVQDYLGTNFSNCVVKFETVTISSVFTSYLNKHLKFSVIDNSELGIDVRATAGATSTLKATITNAKDESSLEINNVTGRRVILDWGNTAFKFPNYHVQLLRLLNTDQTKTSSQDDIIAELDWSRALNIETSSSSKQLSLSLAGGDGYFVWRVRPIGTYYDGGISNPLNYGTWSYDPGNSLTITPSTNDNNVIKFTDPDKGKNYIYNRVFFEENKVKEGITYANGLNQVKQVQANGNSSTTTVIQSVQDYSGRPSLQTLPVPVDGKIGSYKEQFIKSGNELYTAKHFDSKTTLNNPSALKTPDYDGVGVDYYNKLNTKEDGNIPDAGGYPYSRTIYKNDGTGRVIEQSGVGATHKIGSTHTVKTTYSKATQSELIRVFGDEAPDAISVLKTTTIDQNGSASITYTSKEGNVIATCLNFNQKSELLEDVSDTAPPAFTITAVADDNKVVDGAGKTYFISTAEFSIIEEAPVTMTYKLPDHSMQASACSDLNFGLCNFTLEVELYRNGELFRSLTKNNIIPGNTIDLGGESWIKPDNTTSTLGSLPIGSYMVKKTLYPQKTKDDVVTASFKNNTWKIDPLANVFVEWLGKVNTEEDVTRFYSSVLEFNRILEEGKAAGQQSKWDQLYTPTTTFNSDIYLGAYTAIAPICRATPSVPPALEDIECFKFSSDHSVQLFTQLDVNKNYNSGAITSQDLANGIRPKLLVIKGGCCGPLEIPIGFKLDVACISSEELLKKLKGEAPYVNAHALVGNSDGYYSKAVIEAAVDGLSNPIQDMLSLLELKLLNGRGEGNSNLPYSALFGPGYTRQTVSAMLFHMLTDQYTDPKDNQVKSMYTCDVITQCWKNTIFTYEQMLPQEDEKQSVDPRQTNDGGEKNDLGDEISKGLGKSPIKPFIMFYMWLKKMGGEDKLNKKADDQADAKTKKNGAAVTFTPDFLENFLNCTGYKFMDIVSPGNFAGDPDANVEFSGSVMNLHSNATTNTKKIALDFAEYKQDRQDYIANMYSDPSFATYFDNKTYTLAETYLLSPIFAFKYFEKGTDVTYAKKKVTVDQDNCLVNFTSWFNATVIASGEIGSLCYNPCDSIYVSQKDLSFSQRKKVFDELRGRQEIEEPADDGSPRGLMPPCSTVVDEAVTRYNNMRVEAISKCKERRGEFKQALLDDLKANCFIIVDCQSSVSGTPNSTPNITVNEIELLTDEMVKTCSAACEINMNTGFYNTGNVDCLDSGPCWKVAQSSSSQPFEKLDFTRMVTPFPNRSLNTYEMVSSWRPRVFLKGMSQTGDVNCSGAPTAPSATAVVPGATGQATSTGVSNKIDGNTSSVIYYKLEDEVKVGTPGH